MGLFNQLLKQDPSPGGEWIGSGELWDFWWWRWGWHNTNSFGGQPNPLLLEQVTLGPRINAEYIYIYYIYIYIYIWDQICLWVNKSPTVVADLLLAAISSALIRLYLSPTHLIWYPNPNLISQSSMKQLILLFRFAARRCCLACVLLAFISW